MDRLESELGPSGYLVGDRFTVADLAAASLFTPAAHAARAALRCRGAVCRRCSELRDELIARPGGAWVDAHVRAPPQRHAVARIPCTQRTDTGPPALPARARATRSA